MAQFTVLTFGCQMNQHDSDRLREVLFNAGYQETEDLSRTDLVLLNTCSVREKAEQKLRSEVGRLGLEKKRRPGLTIAVGGCVAQQEGERLLAKMPFIDLIFGPDNIAELPRLLSDVEAGAPPQVRTVFDLDEPRFLRAKAAHGPTAFVTTMKGCDERCTFCIVPTTRGPERYRPSGEILDEICRLVETGVREITLLGQTVDSYRDPSGVVGACAEQDASEAPAGDESEFPLLLRRIASQAPELRRLRYTSPHPRHLTPALIAAHRDLDVLAKHVHMPVQSGSNRVLKRMLRRYTVAEYLERTDRLRDAVPGLTLSTDLIVGFPGETREDFEATLRLVEQVGFVSLFAFKYSPRPFTPALKLRDDVPDAEKSARLSELLELSARLTQRHLAGLVGQTCEVLVEGTNRDGAYSGRTERNEIVHFACSDDPTGELVELNITEAFKHSLAGELSDASRRRPLARAEQVTARRSLAVI